MIWKQVRNLTGVALLSIFLTGCSGPADWFGRGDGGGPLPPPLEADADGVVPDKTRQKQDAEAPETEDGDDTGEASEAASSETDADAAKPEAAQRQLAGALISDQEKARHSDEELRGGRVAAVAPPRPAPPAPPVKRPEPGRSEAAEPSPPALPQGRVTGAPLPARQATAPAEAVSAPAAPSPAASTATPQAPPPAPAPQPVRATPAPQPASAAPQINRLVPQPAARPAPLAAQRVTSAAIPAPAPASPAARALPSAATYPATGFQPSRAQPLPPSLLAALPPGVASRYQETAATVIGAGAANAGSAGASSGAYSSIPFAPGSTRLSPSDLAKIARTAERYRSRGGLVRLVGHASGEAGGGSASEQMIANWEISQARANVVADALITGGVAAIDVLIEAVGDGGLAGGSGAAYRRVDIYIE